MTVSEWIKKNGRNYRYCDFTIIDENQHIILDDRLAYLSMRSKDYNANWRKKCRGKQVLSTEWQHKGIILVVG